MPESIERVKAKRFRHRHRARHRLERIILIGNPNVGKSVIFGLLTGKYVTVSNYPGTTVEVLSGNIKIGEENFLIIDSPGVNSLIPMSEDEQVTRDILINEKHKAVVLIADSKNLKRSLVLLIQLAEMGLPCILDLNMIDEAKERGIEIDYKRLSELLNIEVIPTVASHKKGINQLRESLLSPKIPSIKISYGNVIDTYVNRIADLLPESNISKKSIALMILSGDESLKNWLLSHLDIITIKKIEELRDEAQSMLKNPISQIITQERIKLAEELTKKVQKNSAVIVGYINRNLDIWTMHPVYGIPILLMIIILFYLFVGKFGAGVLVDFIQDTIFGMYIVPVLQTIVKKLIHVTFFQELLIGEFGIFTMAITYAFGIILPITTTFFIAFGLLEDSGYLPRLSILSNKFFRLLGLNGKAILPMVLGLGCGTMATLTTRILETNREKIIATFLIALAIPCSAQLGVIFGMLSAFSLYSMLWWAGTIFFVLIFVGFLAGRLLPGERSEFFMEIPPLRLPVLRNILLKTLNRVEWYIKEAVPLFILGTLVLFLLDKTHVLRWINYISEPVISYLLGLPKEVTNSFLMGFLRRDYGAAGLFDLTRKGLLNEKQIIVSVVTLTLFVPCIANFFMMIKERGLKTAILMMSTIIPFALIIGGILNRVIP